MKINTMAYGRCQPLFPVKQVSRLKNKSKGSMTPPPSLVSCSLFFCFVFCGGFESWAEGVCWRGLERKWSEWAKLTQAHDGPRISWSNFLEICWKCYFWALHGKYRCMGDIGKVACNLDDLWDFGGGFFIRGTHGWVTRFKCWPHRLAI